MQSSSRTNLGVFGYSCPLKEQEEFTTCYTEFIANINKEKPEFIWPTIKEFTIEEGAVKIDEYLSSFYTEENWMYVMYYRGVQESSSLSAYKYQVSIVINLFICNHPFTGHVQFTNMEIPSGPSHCKLIFCY